MSALALWRVLGSGLGDAVEDSAGCFPDLRRFDMRRFDMRRFDMRRFDMRRADVLSAVTGSVPRS